MAIPFIPNEGLSGIMAVLWSHLIAGGDSCKVRLFKLPIVYSPSLHWTDFTECDFAGYAPRNLPTPTDQGLGVFPIDTWRFPTITWDLWGLPGQTVWGYWIDCIPPLTGQRTVLWAQQFGTPFAFVNVFDLFPLILTPGLVQGPYCPPAAARPGWRKLQEESHFYRDEKPGEDEVE